MRSRLGRFVKSMSALEELVEAKLAKAKEEKSQRQSGRFRLVADVTIKVSAIQEVLTRHCKLKKKAGMGIDLPSTFRTAFVWMA